MTISQTGNSLPKPLLFSLGPFKTASYRSGLSLIEVLVSIAILSAGAVIVLQALARVSYAQLVSEQQTKLYLFSLSKMSELEIASQEGVPPKENETGRIRLDNQTLDWSIAANPIPDEESFYFTTISSRLFSGSHSSEMQISTIFRVQEDSL